MILINKKYWIKRDKKFRNIFAKLEAKKIVLKSLIYNYSYNLKKKIYFNFKFNKFTYKSSISYCRNNCMFLGNSRAIIQQFKLSRHACKKYASHGFIVGLKKSSF